MFADQVLMLSPIMQLLLSVVSMTRLDGHAVEPVVGGLRPLAVSVQVGLAASGIAHAGPAFRSLQQVMYFSIRVAFVWTDSQGSEFERVYRLLRARCRGGSHGPEAPGRGAAARAKRCKGFRLDTLPILGILSALSSS